jgi:peptide deformylase
MAVRDIVLYPASVLLTKAEPVERFGPSISRLVMDMFETMAAHDGVGLAAPQIGVSKRILVVHEPESGREMCLINPEMTSADGRETGEEGCLSLPQIYAPVSRYARIEGRAVDETGEAHVFEAEGMLARIIQHEMDHLDGIVFFDRLDVLTLDAKRREWDEVRAQLTVPTGAQ